MIKLQIKNMNNYEYELIDDGNNTYKIRLEFYDLGKAININDYIFMSEKLLDPNYEEYSNFYRFGKLNSEYGRKINSEDNIDIIGIKKDDDLIYLQRYYG